MAKYRYIVSLLCLWVLTLTFILTYFFLKESAIWRDSAEQRLLLAAPAYSWEDAPALDWAAAGSRLDWRQAVGGSPSSEAVLGISNSAIRKELGRILSVPESSAGDPKVAFDKVVALSSLLPRIRNISRMKTPTPETFQNYIAPMGLPVVFTDMLEGEKLGSWTWEYVRSKWGKTVYQNTRQGNYSTKTSKAGKHLVNRVSVSLEDFIDVVTGKKVASKKERGMYIAKKRVIPVEALEAEFHYPPFYPGVHKHCYLEPTGW